MLLENFLISNVIFTRRAIFSTLYVGKSSGKQDHYDVRGYCMACHIKNLLEFKKKCILDISWIWFGWICRHPATVSIVQWRYDGAVSVWSCTRYPSIWVWGLTWVAIDEWMKRPFYILDCVTVVTLSIRFFGALLMCKPLIMSKHSLFSMQCLTDSQCAGWRWESETYIIYFNTCNRFGFIGVNQGLVTHTHTPV